MSSKFLFLFSSICHILKKRFILLQKRLCAAVTNKVMFVRSFIEDEGRSFEIGFQEQPP
ncbi:hypothetical protein [Wolbachia endosymbiont (group A) of Beris morrisii]|uniref:hypothetical protein n=1 Tax=Wolbachia endosymbiont (group A) of Beris morrisii TaxID=3066139 RepID=UPI00334271E2